MNAADLQELEVGFRAVPTSNLVEMFLAAAPPDLAACKVYPNATVSVHR